MSVGLIALIDDVIGLAKLAVSSLDDVTAQASRASMKAAGVVIDDAAVTPRYVVGLAAERELPIIARIAIGSLRNKLLFLLPGALLLGLLAPWAITPILMLGGAYLSYEGAEKVWEALWPHAAHEHEAKLQGTLDPQQIEDQKVQGAIRTDLILSAEVMAITLATVAEASFLTQVVVLAIVGVGITLVVYGAVALIVKADDAGMALAASGSSFLRTVGSGLVHGMPYFLKGLSVLGTAAMLWVGGGIIIHGLAGYGLGAIEHGIHGVAVAVGHALAAIQGTLEWLVTAAASGVFGLLVGAVVIVLVHYLVEPVLARARG